MVWRMAHPHPNHSIGLGWLAWLTGLLPILGVTASAYIAMSQGLVPACNPFLEGCTSVSATGRQFPASLAFRAALLPAAALTALFWLACWHWLRHLGSPGGLGVHLIPLAGLLAGVFLVVYVSFLGTESDIYSFMRRFGVIHYFSMTFLGQLLVTRAVYRLPGPPLGPRRMMLALCTAMLVLGLASILVDLAAWDTDAVENIMEWNGALLMMFFFPTVAWAWQRTGFRLHVGTGRGET